MNLLVLALALCGQADLSAEGYVLQEIRDDGTRVWSKPVTAMQCGSGSCGSMMSGHGCSSGSCSSQRSQMGCSSGSCGSQRGGGEMAMGGRVPRLVPIEKDEPSAPSKPVTPSAPIAKAEPLDYEKLANALADKLASDGRFKGPKGDKGDPGADGKDAPPVDEAKIAALVLSKIDYAKIAGMVNAHPGATDKEVHYVVVLEDGTDYAQRVTAAVGYAKQRFAGITTSPPPSNYVGLMPVIVKYTNGVPEYVAKGQYETEQALSRLAMGKGL